MTDIAPHITAFLRQRLGVERAASPHTCDTYAYAFQLLFAFASQKLGIPPSALQIEHIDAPLVLAFLEHLQIRNTDRSFWGMDSVDRYSIRKRNVSGKRLLSVNRQ